MKNLIIDLEHHAKYSYKRMINKNLILHISANLLLYIDIAIEIDMTYLRISLIKYN